MVWTSTPTSLVEHLKEEEAYHAYHTSGEAVPHGLARRTGRLLGEQLVSADHTARNALMGYCPGACLWCLYLGDARRCCTAGNAGRLDGARAPRFAAREAGGRSGPVARSCTSVCPTAPPRSTEHRIAAGGRSLPGTGTLHAGYPTPAHSTGSGGTGAGPENCHSDCSEPCFPRHGALPGRQTIC